MHIVIIDSIGTKRYFCAKNIFMKDFSRDIDQKTGYKTKTLLCMPIMIQGNVIGVVQMVNKKNGHFTKSDEESFETFAVYCGLGKQRKSLDHQVQCCNDVLIGFLCI